MNRFRTHIVVFFIVASWILMMGKGRTEAKTTNLSGGSNIRELSLKQEIQHSVDRGLQWLKKQQAKEGYWSQPGYPALTGLVLTAFMAEPTGRMQAVKPDFIMKGYQYLFDNVQPDGGIYKEGLGNYNTSVAIMALIAAYDPTFEPVIRNARNYIVGLQWDFDKKGTADNPLDGGVGYGGRYKHSDMSNTMFALEAIHFTKAMASDAKSGSYDELNWEAAIRFIERCQNLPSYNDQPWASDDPDNKGGFVYFPGDSKAGEMTLPSGKTAFRSYGSMSYAGLLSYIYADLDKHDPRVTAVVDWLQKNFTLDENPGMGKQGLFYYYHTMAKALAAYGKHELALSDGKSVDWRKALATKLFDLQTSDGFWVNESGRWWEKDPVLVTTYSVIALEIVYRSL